MLICIAYKTKNIASEIKNYFILARKLNKENIEKYNKLRE